MWPFSSSAPAAPARNDRIVNRDIMADDPGGLARRRWNRFLVVYLRIIALICLARGMIFWASILGFGENPESFEALETPMQLRLVVFAVLNCICGVGLWLVSAWGAALWLMMTLAELLVPMVFRGWRFDPNVGEIALMVLVACYIATTWFAAREREKAH
ncbi:MAG: DUF6163 family protein [Beijerinckiaceae bacterium]